MKTDYNSFVQDVAKELEKILGDGYTVRCKVIKKNNGVSHQTIVVSDNNHNASPCYSMEKYYELYKKPGDIKFIAEDILKIYRKGVMQDFPVGWLRDKDKILGRVLFRVVSTDRNADILADVPHHDLPELNLSMLFYILLENSCSGHTNLIIYNRHMELLGTSEPELFEHAWKNTSQTLGHTIISMAEFAGLPEMFPGDIPPMYVITNKQNIYGAGCILYPDVLEETAQKLGSDFYLLPSSLHETIAVPAENLDINDAEKLKATVNWINQSELEPEEVLSDNVYYYCRKKRKLSLAI